MKESNLQKKPSSAREYANLFLLDENGKKGDFSNSKNVCLITIGYAETLWILLQEFAGKNITIIDCKSEIDYIETLIKIHKRSDIRIVRKEVETDEAVLSTILDLSMNMFDLIIANSPYRKGGTLAKEISKAILQVADNVVCLQPTSCAKYLFENLQFIENLGPIDDYFATNAKGLGTKISIFKMTSTKQNIYKSFDDVILNNREKEWCKTVKSYNEGKECFAKMLPYLYDKKDFPYEEDLIFEIANWLPYCGVAAKSCKSQDYRHNFLHQPIEWRHGNQQYGMLFPSKETVGNFTGWWYKWENTNEGPFTVLKLILSILNKIGNGDPSINKYPKYFPNLDWSRPWTDQEILAELNLPEDFLSVGLNII